MNEVELGVKTKSLSNSRLAVELNVPASKCKASFDKALDELSRSIKLPGFRKGKVPQGVIIQQIGEVRIKAHALEKLVESSWQEALAKESLKPLCAPELEGAYDELLKNFNVKESLNFTLITDVQPKPKLKAVSGLTAEAEPITFDPNKVEELIKQSQKQLSTLVPVENRAAAKGDVAVISFNGTFADDNTEIKGGSAESMDIELEDGKMIPGFIEGVIGMNLNDEKTITCKFPKEYSDNAAAGRQANFLVKLNDLKVRELPELDDSFAQRASDKKNMDELREDLENRLKEDAKIQNQNNINEALIEALVQELDVEIPKTLIDLEVRNIVERTASQFAQQGMDVKKMFTEDLVKSLMESSRDEAHKNVRKSLAINALVENKGIQVDEKELDEKLKELKNELSDQKELDEQKLKEVVSDNLLQEKVFKWLEANNTVKEKNVNHSTKEGDEKKVKAQKNKSKDNQKKKD